ncbi:MAG: RsmB/NOP family class I SAM-dependent RNA methyltransferase [Henriciella sp.]
MADNGARRAAGDLLIAVLEQGRTLDDAMLGVARFAELTGSDRGFARAMVSAVLRHLGRLDAGLSPFLDRPLADAPASVRALLRLGAAQSWLLETPDHAVVGASVEAAKSWPAARRAAGFINAVLRKVVADRSAFDASPVEAIWPDWLWQDLSGRLGETAARACAEAQTAAPALHLTPRDGDAVALASRLGGQVIGAGSVELPLQAVDQLPGYETGDWWVQDAAAALPAQLLAVAPGEHVLDLCAAPGGKTLQLAARGARCVALDRSRPRLRRLRENLARTGLDNVTIVTADATTWTPETLFDHVLLDAPCSALGTLRRHPEGAWIKSAADVARFQDIQDRLLAAASRMVRPGGQVVYCVCSPRPQEGVDRVEASIARGSGLVRRKIRPEDVGAFSGQVTAQGDVLTLPGAGFAYDGFYMARLIRSAD